MPRPRTDTGAYGGGRRAVPAKEAYLRTRELIQQGTNPFNPRLLEVPDWEYSEAPFRGASGPDTGGPSTEALTEILEDLLTMDILTELEPGSGEAKVAMSEVRAYGGQWTVVPLQVPDSAKTSAKDTIMALERGAHPHNLRTRWGDLVYASEEIEAHVVQQNRPPISKVVGLFWAPGDDAWHTP